MSDIFCTFARNFAQLNRIMAVNKTLSCIFLTPYYKFKDGTQGCIIVIDWQSANPAVFLFNSLDRQPQNQNVNKQFLLPFEYQMLMHYIKEGEQEKYFLTGDKLKEAYSTFGVARLCGNFISAHIADLIGENINAQRPQHHFDTSRTKEMLAGAHLRYTNRDLEDELLLHMDSVCQWERSLIAQALPVIARGYNHDEWLKSILKTIRTAFVGTFENITVQLAVDFGHRLAAAYAADNKVMWWRELEKSVSMQHQNEFRYIDFGIQEIIAFYGLSKYIGKEQPMDELILNVEKVPLEKRIDIFKDYKDHVEKECLEELRKADNPLLSAMPTKQDAQKEAKERMQKNLGKIQDWLPEQYRFDYSQYEQAFCQFAGIGDFEAIKEKKKNPYAKERAGIRAVFESGICKHKSDWGAVFRILVEKETFSDIAYLAAADFINDICGIEVTNKDALRQSPAMHILKGSAENGWKNRAPENRESGKKVLFYQKIAETYFSAI